MIRINLLPHREEKRKARQKQFATLAAFAAMSVGVMTDPSSTGVPLKLATVRLLKVMPVPDIVLEAPDIVSVPPVLCVNDPTSDVDKLPDTDIEGEALIFNPANTRLLKLCAPLPLIVALVPDKVIVLVLPVKVPLLIQLLAAV